MPDSHRLKRLLERIDGRSYPAYRDVRGTWQIEDLTLIIDHVQGDPFAAPSRLRLRVQTGIRREVSTDRDAKEAAEDWLLRRFGANLVGRSRGSGRSGRLDVYRPGPEILERSGVRLGLNGVAEVRFTAGLPAQGRRVLGQQAWYLLTDDVAAAASHLIVADDNAEALDAHVASVQAQRAFRRQLHGRGLAAFIADGSVLPRRSGVDQRPLQDAVPFRSPPSLRIELDTDAGPVAGMGIPHGVVLITGGGFHGKSTVLAALQRGHLDHIPGDGRERVVADLDTVKIRAEDGRRVEQVDISGFLRDLPGGRSTAPFSSDDASGSTSQAAAIVEAAEAGAKVLLLDEDTSATNLLVRDARMRALIPREREPITPFVERVREVRDSWGVSTVMVVGGVGDYLAVADPGPPLRALVAHADLRQQLRGAEAAHLDRGRAARPFRSAQPLPGGQARSHREGRLRGHPARGRQPPRGHHRHRGNGQVAAISCIRLLPAGLLENPLCRNYSKQYGDGASTDREPTGLAR